MKHSLIRVPVPDSILMAVSLAVLACMVLSVSLSAATVPAPIVITGADVRPATSLNGEWSFIVDPYFVGLFGNRGHEKTNGYFLNLKGRPGDARPVEYNFATAPKLRVPGDWNTQRPWLLYYEGPMWYQRDFTYQPREHTRIFLHLGAANYRSWFWVNGQKVCQHEGGFTSFNCDVTSAIHPGSNFVVAAVDSTRLADGVPTLQFDWWNYGGLTRTVSLIEVPDSFIDQYDVHLERGTASVIAGWAHVVSAAPGQAVTLSIPELNAQSTSIVSPDGHAAFRLDAHGLVRWSPETPRLYKVRLTTGQDSITDLIGFRTIETRGAEILLNGKPIFLRGVCIQGEAPYRLGRAYTTRDADILLGWAKELGANFVRLVHYPHDETMQRAADRMGLLVWSEIPVYQGIEFDNPAVLAKASQQLEEEINTSRNHASIIIWSMANETPNNPVRTQFISTLAAQARQLDPTRLISAALLVRTQGNTKIVDDPLGSALDVIGANEYIGWYDKRPQDADTTAWNIDYQKPLIMSEFGGAAKAGLHGPDTERWTEEYQANIYRHQLVMFNHISQLRGLSAWVLMDFRSPNRPLAGIQDEFNRKGLISDQGHKKLAFYVLQKAYKQKSVGKPDYSSSPIGVEGANELKWLFP